MKKSVKFTYTLSTTQIFSVCDCLDISYHKPRFSQCATWNPDAITFANESLIGSNPQNVFVDNNNALYLTDAENNRVLVWSHGSASPTRVLQSGLSTPEGLFVTMNEDVFIDNGGSNGRVDKWALKTNNSVRAMNITSSCSSLFIDTANSLYCSMSGRHEVLKRILSSSSMIGQRVAGTGVRGSASKMLHTPYGIFVDTDFNLYVADYQNSRIQLFHSGLLDGVTVVGSFSINPTISLYKPIDVTLDGNKNLFILEYGKHRIIAQGIDGFRCIVGCSGSYGSSADRMSWPRSLSFDSDGKDGSA
jgi:sugar lactone lactonase YvrE